MLLVVDLPIRPRLDLVDTDGLKTRADHRWRQHHRRRHDRTPATIITIPACAWN
jgi:hypothetical protein